MSLKRKLPVEPTARFFKKPKQTPALHLDARCAKRDAFYQELHSKHLELASMTREDSRSRALRDSEKIRKERANRVFRANPVRYYSALTKTVERQHKLTVPAAPRLRTAFRTRTKPDLASIN